MLGVVRVLCDALGAAELLAATAEADVVSCEPLPQPPAKIAPASIAAPTMHLHIPPRLYESSATDQERSSGSCCMPVFDTVGGSLALLVWCLLLVGAPLVCGAPVVWLCGLWLGWLGV